MALLTLKDIGKIYVSDGNVAVGIRGVNLSFERGEFVAITGKSGSGKSTLLNVISGMDTYEEGELFIEGQPTSHYLQPEWEEYRQKYISFIFQDYNIIESFTVLQNVELALMHITDKKERRARATELIKRVGLLSHIKQKGSKLSGGQKQRTVIARALAKDSPIILADEPTGNLDSATSKEIIELLKEVSEDKLLIVVTHNFEQVEGYATRHIRTFDGAIESDHAVKAAPRCIEKSLAQDKQKDKKQERKETIKNGISLGSTIFLSKPKLSVFLCFLMIVGTLGIFLVTALCGEAGEMFEPSYMFSHIDGRLVVTKQSGEILTEDEVKKLATEYGAKEHLRYDILLDEGGAYGIIIPTGDQEIDSLYPLAKYTYGKDFGDDIIGRYPQAPNEIFLYLPISYQPELGKTEIKLDEALIYNTTYKIVGVKYFYDNNKSGQCLFTEEGFRVATALHYIRYSAEYNIWVNISDKATGVTQKLELHDIIPSFDIDADKVYIDKEALFKELSMGGNYNVSIGFSSVYHNYNYNYGEAGRTYTFEKIFTDSDISKTAPASLGTQIYSREKQLFISDEILCQMAESVLNESYKQASLFFESDKEAHKAAEKLCEKGYIAVPSDTTYEQDALTAILEMLTCIMMAFVWVLAIVFLAFFINLCSARTLSAFKSDMAIMRSMGIQVKVIRIGMYVRMLISLVPAFILVGAVATLIFTSPKFNDFFVYLYAWQYAFIFIGMLILTTRITHKQINRLFSESVKKSLKGGNAE